MLFDTGWAGTFMKMCKALGEQGIKLQDIKYLLVSHFHPDHMGIAGELAKQGVTVVVMESQKEFVHTSDHIFERDQRFDYVPVNDEKTRLVTFEDSRDFLLELGIKGSIIPTPGHSDDSITLVLDSGDIFVGDLYPLYELEAHEEPEVQESWKRILAMKPKRIFYGHAKTAVLESSEAVQAGAGKAVCAEEKVSHADMEGPAGSTQKNAEFYSIVKKIMHLIDKGASIDKIASKLKLDKEFVSDVCRMYLTHRNVGVQGILDRIEIKGR